MTDIVERCPCCGAEEPAWDARGADLEYINRDAEIERLRAALDEWKLSNVICCEMPCACEGDHGGAYPETAKCWVIARKIRASAGLSIEQKGDQG